MSLSPPQAGAIPLGRTSPSCPAPSCAAQEGTVGMGCPGCRGQPGAGCRVPAGCRKQLEAGDGVSTAAAARPAHAPTLAPLPVSPREMLREELCMRRPAGKIPHGAGGDGVPTTGTGCPSWGRGAHHGDGVPIMGTGCPSWGPSPLQRPWATGPSLPGGSGPGERPGGFGAAGLKAGGRPWPCGDPLVLPRDPSATGGELP